MDTLALKTPLVTKEARVAVQAGLKPGRYQVQLVVAGPSGTSKPATVTIDIAETTRPTGPVLSPTPLPTPAPIGRIG